VELQSIMHFNQLDLNNSINLTPAKNPFEDSGLSLVRAKELFILEYGKPLAENQRIKGEYPVMGSNGITGYHNQFLIKGPSIIVGRKGSAGKVTYVKTNSYPIDTTFYVVNKSDYPLKYIYYLLLVLPLKALSKSMGVPGLNRNDAHALKVPLVDRKNIHKKIEYLDKFFENRVKTFDPKLRATENENIFAEKFRIEIIRTFK
jgi:type I restriction enzyme S subunit